MLSLYVRNVNDLPVYLDVYCVNEFIDCNPEVVCDELDGLPDCSDDKITQKITLQKCYTVNDYLEILKQISMVGDRKMFLETFQMICLIKILPY